MTLSHSPSPHDVQLALHHQLMGRSMSSLPAIVALSLPSPAGSPSRHSLLLDPLGQRVSPSPYDHALSYRPASRLSNRTPEPLLSPTLLAPPQTDSLSSSSISSSSSSSASSSTPSSATSLSHPSVCPPRPSTLLSPPPFLPSFASSSASGSPAASSTPSTVGRPPSFSRPALSSRAPILYDAAHPHRQSGPIFDPDLEAERVRLYKLEKRRSMIGLSQQSRRPPSARSMVSTKSFNPELNLRHRTHSTLPSRLSSRPGPPNSNQVYRPSPLRSASTPDLVSTPPLDPKKRGKQLKEEYERMRRDRIKEEQELMRLMKKPASSKKCGWVAQTVKTVKGQNNRRLSLFVTDAVVQPTSTSSTSNSTETEATTHVGHAVQKVESKAAPNHYVPLTRDPCSKCLLSETVSDKGNAPFQLKLGVNDCGMSSRSLKTKLSCLLEGLRVQTTGGYTKPKAPVDLVNPKFPMVVEQLGDNRTSKDEIQATSPRRWLSLTRLKNFNNHKDGSYHKGP